MVSSLLSFNFLRPFFFCHYGVEGRSWHIDLYYLNKLISREYCEIHKSEKILRKKDNVNDENLSTPHLL